MKDKPFRSYRIGLVSCAIWVNRDDQSRGWANFTFERSYRNARGDWESTTGFSESDLTTLPVLATMALDDWLTNIRPDLNGESQMSEHVVSNDEF